MITGAHSIIYSTNPDADRAVLRDVFKLTHVDVGGGWLIFGLPPAEVAVHPSDKNGVHELYLMCVDVEALVAEMARRNLSCAPVKDEGWGLLTQLTLPGGGTLGIYQPRHERPAPMTDSSAKKRKTPSRSAVKRPRKTSVKRSRPRQTATKTSRSRTRGKKTRK
jgi:hypothetical protein